MGATVSPESGVPESRSGHPVSGEVERRASPFPPAPVTMARLAGAAWFRLWISQMDLKSSGMTYNESKMQKSIIMVTAGHCVH